MFKKFFCSLAFLFFAAYVFCAEVAIYHTSDTHGFYYPSDIAGKKTGGFAALAALVKQEKLPYLLLDSGDYTSGTYEAKETKGALSIELMNRLGYAAAVIGNHEGDFGKEAFAENIANSRFDILGANLSGQSHGALPAKVLPYKIYSAGGKKIAVIGIARNPFTDTTYIKTAGRAGPLRKALAQIAPQKPDAVIVLEHLSIAEQEKSAVNFFKALAAAPQVNLVLGGHMHLIKNETAGKTLFVESGANLKGASRIILDFNDKTGKLESMRASYIELDTEAAGQDGDIEAFAAKYYNAELDEPIANAARTFHKYNPEAEKGKIDSPLGNIIADVIKQKTGADIVIQNTEGIRASLPKGIITKRILFDIYPFNNKIIVMPLKGEVIQKIILNALGENGSVFQYSGVRVQYSYKHKRPEIKEILINGNPLQKDQIYRAAMNDYVAQGNSGAYMLKNMEGKEVFGRQTLAQIITEYLQNSAGAVEPPETGRITKTK
jgi:2',3'-cyclic-nucleotide 2'-phosphodiesterase (5'-nucleotidase family)